MTAGSEQGTFERSSFLRIVGIAVALSTSLVATAATVPVAAAMALAVILFLLAERLGPPVPATIPEPSSIRWPVPASVAVGAGILACLGSAFAVADGAALWAQHLPWALGVLAFACTAAAMAGPPSSRLERTEWAAVAILAVACTGFFFVQLTAMPPEVHGDEAETALDALRLLEESDRGLFSTSWFGLPILHAAPTALGFILFGPDLFGLRMTSALLASASVFLLFATVRRLVDTPLALVSALALAGQRYFVHLGRSGYHYVDTPFLSLLALWLMVRVWQDRRAGSVIWCGIVLGLGVQTYYASRLIPLLIALTSVVVAACASRGKRRRHLYDLGLVAIIALAVAAPLFGYYADHLDELWGRTQETSIFNPESLEHLSHGYRTTSFREILAIQARQALSVFHFAADTSVQYGYQAPLLDIFSGVFFLAGAGTLLARPFQPLTWIIVSWIGLPILLGGVLTIDTPFYPRLSGIVPFVALVVGTGVMRCADAVAAFFAPGGRRGRFVPRIAAFLTGIVLAANAASYFVDYAPNHRHSPMREISEWIQDQGRGSKTYLFDNRNLVSIYHGAISFLAGSFARQDVEDVPAFLADPSIVPRRSRFIVMEGSQDVLPLLEKKFGAFDVTTYRDLYGQVRFYAAKPSGVGDHGLAPRAGRVPLGRARPWLALIAALAAVGIAAIIRARRQDRTPLAVHAPNPPSGQPPDAPSCVQPLRLSRAVVFTALALIVTLAAVLRLAQLEQLPAGFYCDEAGNIYNAASILGSGRDESGTAWPLYIWSFGTSYKNPVFIYAATIPVALFGPGPFAARVTAATFGVIGVIALFFLGRAIFGPVAGLMAALFLAVIPWHLHFSRIGFELISFPALFLIGAAGLVAFTNGRRSLAWAALALGASLYTYVPAKMFVPLFLGAFVLLYRRELWQRWRESLVGLAVLIAVAAPTIVFDLSNQSRSTQYLRGTTFITEDMGAIDIASQLGANYTHFFSPTFLFHRGDRILRHAVRGHGELYGAMAPFLLLALVAVAHHRSRKTALVLIWLALYPSAAAFIRREIPSASRAIIGAPAFCLLAGIGADWLWRRIVSFDLGKARGKVIAGVALAGLAIVLGAQTQRYWNLYSEDYPIYTAKHFTGFQYGHQRVVEYFLEHYDEYDRFLLSTTLSNQPEIFLRLFAGMKQPPTAGTPPFEMPAKMDRGTPNELHLYKGDRLLFAVVPKDLLFLADYDVLERVVAPDGTTAFLITEVREAKDFVHAWMVAGPYPVEDMPPLPDYEPAAPPATAPGGGQWQRYQLRRAAVTLDHLFGGTNDDSCAWALNFVHSRVDQTVNVFAGFDDAGEIWVNGERIPLSDEDNPFQTWVDTSNGRIDLRAGRNSIAVKTCDIAGAWRFYFRLAGNDGRKVPGIDWEYVFEEGF